MKNITKFFLIYLLSFVFACQKRIEVSEQTPVAIPNVEVLATDSTLVMQQGILSFQSKLYSGFVIEKYENNQIASKNAYFNGRLEGKQEKWYLDGKKMEVRFYKENRKTGKHNGWWENGQKKFEYVIKDDVPIETHREWYANGQLYSIANYSPEGQPEGTQQSWFQSGKIKSNFVIKNGRRFGFFGAKGCMGENEKKTIGFTFGKK